MKKIPFKAFFLILSLISTSAFASRARLLDKFWSNACDSKDAFVIIFSSEYQNYNITNKTTFRFGAEMAFPFSQKNISSDELLGDVTLIVYKDDKEYVEKMEVKNLNYRLFYRKIGDQVLIDGGRNLSTGQPTPIVSPCALDSPAVSANKAAIDRFFAQARADDIKSKSDFQRRLDESYRIMRRNCVGKPSISPSVREWLSSFVRVHPSQISLNRMEASEFTCTAIFHHPNGTTSCSAIFDSNGRIDGLRC